MRVLVTGGAGYLGSHLVPMLLEEGHTVRVFDRFCFGETALEAVSGRPDCEIIHGDVRRLQESAGLLQGIDAVIHLAALSNDPSCALDEDMAEDVNVESTRELVNLSLQSSVKRFIYASTCSVYGQGAFEQLDELSPANPVSPYGATCLRAEQALLGMRNARFEPVVARLATLFGWSGRMRFDLAVNQMAAMALRTGTIQVFGGGSQWRPFLHVRDAARALLLLLHAPEDVSGEIYNVGSDGLNFRIASLAEKIAAFFPNAALDTRRDDDDVRTFHVRFEKFAKAFQFEPEHTLADGVAELRARLDAEPIDPTADAYFNVHTMKRLLATPVGEGGEPMAPRLVPLYRPTLGPEEEETVVRTLRGGWLTSGARVPSFEKLLAETVGASSAVAVNSCTAALHLCLMRAGVGRGDEVILPPITWASTANTMFHMGAKPVFVDVLPDTLNIDPAAIEAAITDRTKAIMPVHLAGQPCDLDPIYAVARKHGIAVVEDAAHALGAAYKGKRIGEYGGHTCFSFYAIKNITTIEGGAVALKDPAETEWFHRMAMNGLGHSAWDRYGRSSSSQPVEVLEPGFKYHLNDVSAAIGIEQLRKFPSFRASRTRLARLYYSVLGEIDEIALPRVLAEVEHAWHLLIIRLRLDKLKRTRDEIRDELRRENIGTGLHFYGLHLHEFFQRQLGLKPEDLPNSTAASMDMISLPLYPLMEDKHIQQVVQALKKVLAHAK